MEILFFFAGASVLVFAISLTRPVRQTRRRPRKKTNYRRSANVSRPPRRKNREFSNLPKGSILVGKAFVIDGDSIVVKNTEVRLFGIDAPEGNHPYGQNAKWALVKMCKGFQIQVEVVEQDQYGRVVARCRLPDGRGLSAEMVKLGLAIDWAKFSGGEYRPLEVPDARKKMWLADARQKGRMHVWQQYEARQKRSAG